MILDTQTLLSDSQVVTATAPSTNVIDLRPNGTPYGNIQALKRDVGKGRETPFLVQVTETFATLTSLTITVQTSDDVTFATSRTLFTTVAIPVAELKAGYQITTDVLPYGGAAGMGRYLRMLYTVTGANATLGKITAGIVMGVQTSDTTY